MEQDKFNEFRRLNKLGPPIAPKGKKSQHILHLTDDAWEGLRKASTDLGYQTFRGYNVTALLEAIGNGLLEVRIPIYSQVPKNEDTDA